MPRSGFSHTDIPEFQGADRTDTPARLLSAMGVSGLFEAERIPIVTAVAWFYRGDAGGLRYWPERPEGRRGKDAGLLSCLVLPIPEVSGSAASDPFAAESDALSTAAQCNDSGVRRSDLALWLRSVEVHRVPPRIDSPVAVLRAEGIAQPESKTRMVLGFQSDVAAPLRPIGRA